MHKYPALHNAMWPGLVGKGPDSEPPIDLETMLNLTAAASVGGVKFEGVDLFLFDPHVNIDASDDDLKRLADQIASRNLVVGSLVAPVWPPTGGGSAMGSDEERKNFVDTSAQSLPHRQDAKRVSASASTASSASTRRRARREWAKDPAGNQKKIAETFRQACDVAEGAWRAARGRGRNLLGRHAQLEAQRRVARAVNRPKTLGFQADMAHTLLFTLGYNAPEDRILPEGYDWSKRETLDDALKTMTHALRPWTIDFHVAQNDATVKGSGSHDKTGRHCLPKDPNGKLDIARHAGAWLRDDSGKVTKALRHICWDGCMFPNATMMQASTWNDVLGAMIAVRDAHGWD